MKQLTPDVQLERLGLGDDLGFGDVWDVGPENTAALTTLLDGVRRGDRAALDELTARVYPELRRIAAHYMRGERPEHTLQTTALINEAYLHLFGEEAPSWQNRAHFFAAVAREMRHILVDYARARNALKGPGPHQHVPISAIRGLGITGDDELLALDEALTRLERVEPRASRVVELRYFVGLSEQETAEALDISISTLKRDWTFAKAWLFSQLGSEAESP